MRLLGSGTSPNEAFRSCVNRWFRNQPEVFAQTIRLQLQANFLACLLTHNTALHSRTLRRMRHVDLLFHAVATMAIADEEWAEFIRRPLAFPVEAAKEKKRQAIKGRALQGKAQAKRPRKRTVFTSKRKPTAATPPKRARAPPRKRPAASLH
ncbi:unnamed protein product [Prorocentrum cordatum]|uniref:Uncharacterized protein n=1 Tax=Prorocentrum cordatum TaxID=2364126 RepID=A0ABN9UQS9_9DINO|nr:unnamed protein product [Polarella glacialis]